MVTLCRWGYLLYGCLSVSHINRRKSQHVGSAMVTRLTLSLWFRVRVILVINDFVFDVETIKTNCFLRFGCLTEKHR